MSKEIAEEKYVSIEFDTWNNRYKPMEEENQRLREQLKENKIKVHIYLNGEGGISRPIGYLQVATFLSDMPDSSIISWEQRNWMEKIVKDGVYEAIRKNDDGAKYYYGREEVEEASRLLKNAADEFDKARVENINRIANIPKLIKWLFKIK